MPPQTDAAAPERYDNAAVAHFLKRLLEERKRALKQLGQMGEALGTTVQESTSELTAYPFHMADQGTDTEEREKNFLFASQEGRLLWHLDEALRRLYKAPETFGRCHSCDALIAFERLDALPQARFCVACKQREEAAGPG
jgi:RNA polymerase-binding transcription factor DksA